MCTASSVGAAVLLAEAFRGAGTTMEGPTSTESSGSPRPDDRSPRLPARSRGRLHPGGTLAEFSIDPDGRFSCEYVTRYAGLFEDSPQMRAIRHLIEATATTDATVLIRGESGVGKELVARAIHAASCRHGKPWVKVNCAAIPAELLEAELFGHERGAFTGATRRRL